MSVGGAAGYVLATRGSCALLDPKLILITARSPAYYSNALSSKTNSQKEPSSSGSQFGQIYALCVCAMCRHIWRFRQQQPTLWCQLSTLVATRERLSHLLNASSRVQFGCEVNTQCELVYIHKAMWSLQRFCHLFSLTASGRGLANRIRGCLMMWEVSTFFVCGFWLNEFIVGKMKTIFSRRESWFDIEYFTVKITKKLYKTYYWSLEILRFKISFAHKNHKWFNKTIDWWYQVLR